MVRPTPELGVDIGRLDVAVRPVPRVDAGPWQQMAAPDGAARERRHRRRVAAPVTIRHPPPRVRARRPAEEARLTRQPPVLLAHLGRDIRAAVRAGRVVRARVGGRPARLPGERGQCASGRRRWYWSSENYPASESRCRRRSGERRDHRHHAGPAAVLGEWTCSAAQVLVTSTRSHARVGAVPRGPPDEGERKACPPDRRRPLPVREPGRDAQAPGRVRPHPRPAAPRPRRVQGRGSWTLYKKLKF